MTQETRYDCREAFRRLDDFLDRELTRGEIEGVQEHLDTCAACAREFAFEARLTRDIKTKLRRLEVPADLKARILRSLPPKSTES